MAVLNNAPTPDEDQPSAAAEENSAVWLIDRERLEIKPYSLPQSLGSRDARIRIKAVGICGSDVAYVKTMACGEYEVKEPMVMGHESAGIVEEIGSSVDHLIVGDRVAIEPGISCGLCLQCKTGHYNLCPKMRFFATPPVHGSLAQQIIHPADLCFKLPDGISLEEGAMCEPLSVAVHACRRAGVGVDTHVLIIGGGPIGLISLLVARAFGSPRIVLADVGEKKLTLAKKLGVDEAILVSRDEKDLDKEEAAIQAAMGDPVDVTLDCVGLQKSMTCALRTTRAGGRVCLVGMRGSKMTVPMTPASAREVDIIGSFRYCNTYPLSLKLLETGKVDVRPLITNRYGFSQKEVEEAFHKSATDKTAVKVMFHL